MTIVGMSLRNMVEDWLAPDPKRGFRVSRYGRSSRGRYVCVVADNGAGSRAMFFFRHRTGHGASSRHSQKDPPCRLRGIVLNTKA
ncbi:hypothetical protein B0G80_1284 [Paraburkholderia sp. BL6669N2]|nr:hypothetical protein B0G80_1284 [Paraburkholderia sp. BL6669N2]